MATRQFFCSPECADMFLMNPLAYEGKHVLLEYGHHMDFVRHKRDMDSGLFYGFSKDDYNHYI